MATVLIIAILFTSLTSSVYSLREKCCEDLGVPEKCFKPLCNPSEIPKVMLRYKLWDPDINCHPYLIPISQCLAKGRDVSSCCYKKGDTDFDYCFGLCNGTMNFDIKMKDAYLSCFVLNVVSIFPCLVSSYTSAPSEPRNLEIVSKTADTVALKWEEPEDSPELVVHYKIHLIERTGQSETETTFTTTDTEYTLENLTSVYSYTVHVVAYGEAHRNDPNWNKSKISNVIPFVTEEELVVSSSEILRPATTTNLTLYCTLRLIKEAEKDVEWKKVNGEELELLKDDKYSVVSYTPEKKKDIILSALKINGFDETDFATYRCFIKNTSIEYSETVVTKFDFSEQAPNDKPPETVLECCSKYTHRENCGSICSKNEEPRKEMLRPGLFLPPINTCQQEIDNLFKCTMKGVDCAGCCIYSKIPYHCLGMCDTRFDLDPKTRKTCQNYLRKAYACKFETMNVKPDAVSNVDTTHLYWYTFKFKWDKAEDASLYHVYNRKKQGAWTVRVTLDNTIDISDSDEVVILSLNEFGYSDEYRLYYDREGWSLVDH